MTRPRKYRRISLDSIDEPTESITSGVENLFDVAMVFAVALIVALAAFWQSPLLFENQDFTAVVNPGKPDMELVVKEGKELKRYQASTEQGSGEGELLGRAYRLPDGKVVYVPTEAERKKNAAAE
ncbi:MAG: DUF2149 domain-containing protein [Thermoguttaceae bacterium]|nr:DUF2149 domain-containing protein [Thermoguttaceae bacterium]MBQ1864151.1 DUF2149 domain-containing protein [Thermoguttaceae bacterium]MBQ2039500.1 DUF2149 domain-containing protein [Thermoguttaceae bacterium]MBQ2555112.1 DUF2149 domain-containing protein [Thermoguttaceae bacterium]MBQ4081017.1 DUF2149 domain-containing protein [Thermoguttaceae bacterium]